MLKTTRNWSSTENLKFFMFLSLTLLLINNNNSNVLIAPCSTADPSIAGAVLLQNKPNTKIERLIILD